MQQMMKQMMSQAGMKPPAGGARLVLRCLVVMSFACSTTRPTRAVPLASRQVAFHPRQGVLAQQPTPLQACPWLDSRP